MSEKAKKLLLNYMKQADWANKNMVRCLLENPSCLEGEAQKPEAHRRAIEYFKTKQEKSKNTENKSYAKAQTIQLNMLIEAYDEAEGAEKKEYARETAMQVLNTPTYWLRFIPDEVKEGSFKIIFKYLEEQMHS